MPVSSLIISHIVTTLNGLEISINSPSGLKIFINSDLLATFCAACLIKPSVIRIIEDKSPYASYNSMVVNSGL